MQTFKETVQSRTASHEVTSTVTSEIGIQQCVTDAKPLIGAASKKKQTKTPQGFSTKLFVSVTWT